MEAAFQRFQATTFHLRQLIKDRDAAEHAYEVHFVTCHCRGNLSWLADVLPKTTSSSASLFAYSTCDDSDDDSRASEETFAGLDTVFSAVHALKGPADSARSDVECAASGVLDHVARHHEAPPSFTVFLSVEEPDGQERSLLSMLARSLDRRTLDVPFLPLGARRSPPARASDCQRAVWRSAFGQGLPRGYEGARFLVSGDRLLQRPAAYFPHLLEMLRTPPGECNSDTAAVAQAFVPAWHAVFGDELQPPLRADDASLPLFLRFEDGPSGFQETKMPKTSTYLAS